MAFLSSKSLIELQTKDKVILPFEEKRVKSGAYELSLGSEVFRTDSKDKKKEILKDDKEQVVINPGQFALLLTEETVAIPKNKISFISIKAGIKLRGLINVSGFHVDPGFNGKLLFSVYNAGSGQISLERGKASFLIWFAELKEEDSKPYKGDHKEQDSILPRYIDDLTKSGELASPNILLEKINNNFTILDGKATTRDYIFRTGMGVLIVIALKIFVDWGMYSKGTTDGYTRKNVEAKMDSTINQLMFEKRNLIFEIDSLYKIKNVKSRK